MKLLLSAGTVTLALLLAGCGGKGGDGDSASAGNAAAPVAAIAAPNGGDWTQMVSATADGGFVMGNPNAPVKLVELASLTCGHCATFAQVGVPALTEKYVSKGQVSLEIRNFVRDPADLAAALLSRCGGATPYFKLTDQIFAAQGEWIGKLQTVSTAEQARLQTLAPPQAAAALGEQSGLVDFVRLRGIPAEKAQACLADEAQLNKLVEMNQKATRDHKIEGTPTFLINGEVVPNASDWGALEPRIREALN